MIRELIEDSEKQPAFEIYERQTGRLYKVWANGHIEGFREGCIILNRIAHLKYAASLAMRELEKVDPNNGHLQIRGSHPRDAALHTSSLLDSWQILRRQEKNKREENLGEDSVKTSPFQRAHQQARKLQKTLFGLPLLRRLIKLSTTWVKYL